MSKRTSHQDRINQTLHRTSDSSVTADFTNRDGDLQNIDVQLIDARSQQPRRQFGNEALQSLVESIRAQGVMQPIIVHQKSSGGFELVAGERRLRAARQAGLLIIPAKVVSALDERQLDFIAAMENLQREDLNPVDEVDAVLNVLANELHVSRSDLPALLSRLRRVDRGGHNVMSKQSEENEADRDAIKRVEGIFSQLAKGNWQSFVANKMGVLKLPSDLLEAVRRGDLEYTKAIALRKVEDSEIRERLLIGAETASLEQLRQMIKDASQHPPEKAQDFTLRLKKIAKADRWKTLASKERAQASKLLEKLESLLGTG